MNQWLRNLKWLELILQNIEVDQLLFSLVRDSSILSTRTNLIRIGLYLNGSNQNEHDYYSKDEIIKLAAPYSDKPFSEAVAIKTGAGHTVRGYDVWSSKKTLEEHALIESNRKAAKKFKLTEKGLTLTLTHIVEHGIKRENDEEGEEEDFGRREWNAQASGSGEKRNGIKPRNSMEWKPPTSQGDEDAEFLRAMKESETEYKRSMSSNDSVHRNAVASGSGSGGVGGLGRNAAKIATKYIAPPPVKATNSLGSFISLSSRLLTDSILFQLRTNSFTFI